MCYGTSFFQIPICKSANLSFIVAMAAIEDFITARRSDLAPPPIVRTAEIAQEKNKHQNPCGKMEGEFPKP
jgi:hypothetical protein